MEKIVVDNVHKMGNQEVANVIYTYSKAPNANKLELY